MEYFSIPIGAHRILETFDAIRNTGYDKSNMMQLLWFILDSAHAWDSSR